MRIILFLLLIAVPFAELAILVRLGLDIGFWWTMAIVVGTALIGAIVLQRQGLQTMQRMSRAMAAGEPPVEAVVDGFFLAISGAFLMTPGVITDCFGLLLLVPGFRRLLARQGLKWFLRNAHVTVHTHAGSSSFEEAPDRPWPGRPTTDRAPGRQADVIDGEFEEIHPTRKRSKPTE